MQRLTTARKFYLALVLPLMVISIIVSVMTYRGLESNAAGLEKALRLQGEANSILSLIQTQDQASMAMLIDPSQLEVFSTRKIEAYDEHKKLLIEIKSESEVRAINNLIQDMATFDESKLRPIDSKILESMFDDLDMARKMYFKDYQPLQKKYEDFVRSLLILTTQNVQSENEKMQSSNLISLLEISFALLLGIAVISGAITYLSRQIEISEANTGSLLESLSEGLFFFNSKGEIPLERSQALTKILPGINKVKTLTDFVKDFSDTPIGNVEVCLDLLWNNDQSDFMSDFSSTVSFLPRMLKVSDARSIKVEYRQLIDKSGKLDRVVAVVADITEQIRNEKIAKTQAERVRKISKIVSSTESYLSFLDEAIALFRSVDMLIASTPVTSSQLLQMKRELHTLKGSLATFEFGDLSAEFHKFETLLESDEAVNSIIEERWSNLKDQWKFETTDIQQVLGLAVGQEKVGIAVSNFNKLNDYAASIHDDHLKGLLADCLRVSASEALSKFSSYIDKLSDKSSEKRCIFSVANDSSNVSHREMKRLDSSFVHLIRNCFDHGIEDAADREKLGKNVSGLIQCAIYRTANGWLHIVIKDDGAGINAERLAQKAVAKGILTNEVAESMTFQQKIELIFFPNLSTRDSVSELSGRGIGMDAVQSSLREMGAIITVYSKPGFGSQFEIDLPPLSEENLSKSILSAS